MLPVPRQLAQRTAEFVGEMQPIVRPALHIHARVVDAYNVIPRAVSFANV